MPPPAEPASRTRALRAQLRILAIVLRNTPFLILTLFIHILRLSSASKYLDLRSDLIVTFLRNLLATSKPEPLSKTQKVTLRDPGIKGRIWVSKVASTVPPEDDIRSALISAIEASGKKWVQAGATCRRPDIIPVEAEWTGYRAEAERSSLLPDIPEAEKYAEMMKECKKPTTVLYLHGGAYYLCDPCTHRDLSKKIAKLTGGRVYSVRYRLAPQGPFPSALLDALVSYFTLLYPPPGAVHEAVPAGHIVFGGDSAGGNLSLALLQTLLEIRRQDRRILWFGEERDVPLPAGVTGNSPWIDMVQSFPSWHTNQTWDYLPPPNLVAGMNLPADDIWPASPPRKHVFLDDEYLLHPLANLHLSDSWKGSPPVYLCSGWECLNDEDRWIAQKLSRDGVKVVYEEYEGMPHVFAMILPATKGSRRCYESWTAFINQAVENPATIESSFTEIKARSCEEVQMNPEGLSSFSVDELKKMAYAAVGRKSSLPEMPAKL